jgi:hypothetical protein
MKNSKFREEIHDLSAEVSNHEREAFKSQVQSFQDVDGATEDGNINWKREDEMLSNLVFQIVMVEYSSLI